MNEINKNVSHILSNISINTNKNKENNVQQTQADAVADYNIIPDTGILGKSQVAKPDSIQADIDFCIKQSPEFLEKCDSFFDYSFDALSQSGEDFAYEKACVLVKEFANEFV